jgi:hypothetical protein
MSRRAELDFMVEHDADADVDGGAQWYWKVYPEGESWECLDSGYSVTEDEAREEAEAAIEKIEDDAAEREHDEQLRRWYHGGRSR